jgi:hypothetical protein
MLPKGKRVKRKEMRVSEINKAAQIPSTERDSGGEEREKSQLAVGRRRIANRIKLAASEIQ